MGISFWCDFYAFGILWMDWIKFGSCMQILRESIWFEMKAKDDACRPRVLFTVWKNFY